MVLLLQVGTSSSKKVHKETSARRGGASDDDVSGAGDCAAPSNFRCDCCCGAGQPSVGSGQVRHKHLSLRNISILIMRAFCFWSADALHYDGSRTI